MRTLSLAEVESVAGGGDVTIGPFTVDLQRVQVGLSVIAVSVAVVASGGIAAVPAATAAAGFLGAAGIAGAAVGGTIVGSAVHQRESTARGDAGS